MNHTSASSAACDRKTALRFFLALFKGTPKDAVFVLQHGETTHVLGERAPLPLDILAAAAQAGERITFSPALRVARDPQGINATPVVWVHVQTDLPAPSVLGQLHALRPAAIVRADEGVDIYWMILGLGSEDAPRVMESLAAELGGSVTSTHALRRVPLRPRRCRA